MSSARQLNESYQITEKLKVDREAGIIYGVRVLGSESRNTHGVSGVEGTEYAKAAHDDARRLYEGLPCNLNHIDGKTKRVVQDVFGEFRNVDQKSVNGKPVTYADLHYLKSHEMSGRVCESVERGMSVFGMSHDAISNKERIDKKKKRLVIEGLESANSIDLVYRPATNRNLWESTEMKTTLKEMLESVESESGKTVARHIIEDTSMAESLACEFDPAGFTKILESVAKIIANEKESARKLLESNESQKIAELAKENAQLKQKDTVRSLCEAEGFVPKPHQLTALVLLESEADRKATIADFKGTSKTDGSSPRSGFRRVNEGEHKPASDAKTFFQRIKL